MATFFTTSQSEAEVLPLFDLVPTLEALAWGADVVADRLEFPTHTVSLLPTASNPNGPFANPTPGWLYAAACSLNVAR